MDMWKLIKWTVFLGIIAIVFLWFTGYKVKGKTIQEHFAPYLQSNVVKEGIRDIRSIVGEGLKTAGEAISEDVTDSERKQLDGLVKKELQSGRPISGTINQKSLPPTPQPGVAQPQTKPDLSKELEQQKITKPSTQ